MNRTLYENRQGTPENMTLQEITKRLDSQLTILDIEGLESCFSIFQETHEYVDEETCSECGGEGHEEFYCDYEEIHWKTCQHCDGKGYIETPVTETEEWSEYETNILI